jgi:hypothetical protein
MNAEQIGGILFWSFFAALVLTFLGLLLDIRFPVRGLAKAGGGIVVSIVIVLIISRFPAETTGGILTWGSLALMYFGLFWALTRKR